MNYKSEQRIHYQRKGISIVEFGLVLLIIGLLAAGVTVVTDMVRAAKVRGIMVDANIYISALEDFYDKYYAYPGDMSRAYDFWADDCGGDDTTDNGGCNGNGNGLVEWDEKEGVKAWQILGLAGFVSSQYSGTCTGTGNACTAVIGLNIPESTYPGGGFFMESGNVADWMVYFGFGKQVDDDASRGGVLKPGDAFNIDQKIDDGLPADGAVRSDDNGDTCHTGTPNEYIRTSSAAACNLYFKYK